MGNSCVTCGDSDSQLADLPSNVGGIREVTSKPPVSDANGGDGVEVEALIRENQLQNLHKLREDLKKNPTVFVLNNLILSVQFFENYERDKEAIKACRKEREMTIARSLSDVRRKCLYEGATAEIVGLKHRYQGRSSPRPEVLGRLRHVLVYENLEVYPEEKYESLVKKDYSSVGDPLYRFCPEEAENMPGYVMLRCVDVPGKLLGPMRMNSFNGTGDSDGYSKLSDYGSRNESARQSSSSLGESDETPPVPAAADSEDQPAVNGRHQSHTAEDKTFKKRPKAQGGRMRLQFKAQPRRDSGVLPLSAPQFPPLKRRGTSMPLDQIGEDVEVTVPHPRTKNDKLRGKLLPTSKSVPNLSNYSGMSSSDDEYGYSRIDDRARPLVCKIQRPRDSSIPDECFRSIRVKVVADSESDPFEIDSVFENRTYLSSQTFMDTFTDAFCDWGYRLGITGMEQASVVRAGVLCTETKKTPPPDYDIHLEFLPAIPVPFWPPCAIEWVMRKRRTIRDVRTNIAYTWPVQKQIQSIAKLGCHLVAEGGRIRGKPTPYSELQWALSFGKAEDYLLSSLTSAHLSCYIWAQLILKDALGSLGIISAYHVKTMLFWLVERNFADWPPEALGERIISIFSELYHALRRGRLPHYFIRKRNLFRSKPNRDLLKAQEKLFRVMENFLPAVIQATRRLHSSRQTYPLPNVTRLWEILTVESSLGNMNKDLLLAAAAASTKPRPEDSFEEIDAGFWSHEHKNRMKLDPYQEKLRRERARREAAAAAKRKDNGKTAEEPVDPVNFELPIQHFDVPRTRMILDFFIEHFIRMTRRSNEFRVYDTSTILLNHAENLVVLLKEAGFADQASVYQDQIAALRHAARNGPVKTVPGLPGVGAAVYGSTTDLPLRRNEFTGSNWSLRKEKVPLPELPEVQVNNKLTKPDVLRTLNSLQPAELPRVNEDDDLLGDLNSSAAVSPTSVTVTVNIESAGSKADESGSEPEMNNNHQLPYLRAGTLFLSDTDDIEESTDF